MSIDVAAVLDGIAIMMGEADFSASGNEAFCTVAFGKVEASGSSKSRDGRASDALQKAIHNFLDQLVPHMESFPEDASRGEMAKHFNNLLRSWATGGESAIAYFVNFSGYKTTKRFDDAHGNYLSQTGYWDR